MAENKDSSQKVQQITGFIDQINFQPSLLALNTIVEAARAGEVGKELRRRRIRSSRARLAPSASSR